MVNTIREEFEKATKKTRPRHEKAILLLKIPGVPVFVNQTLKSTKRPALLVFIRIAFLFIYYKKAFI